MGQRNVHVGALLRRALINRGSRLMIDDEGRILETSFLPTETHPRLSVAVVGHCTDEVICMHFSRIAKSKQFLFAQFEKREVSRLFKVVHSPRGEGDGDGSYTYDYDFPCHADMFHRNLLPKTHQPLPPGFSIELRKFVALLNSSSRLFRCD